MKIYNRFGLILFILITFGMFAGEVDLPWEKAFFMSFWLLGIGLFLWPGNDETDKE